MLALILVRPVTLWLSLLGSRLPWREKAAVAWFGPKGFASVVYGLLVLESGIPQATPAFDLIAVCIYRFDAPLFFANADYFLNQVQELIDEAIPSIDWLLIDAEAIVDIDVTAVEALSKLQSELEGKGVVMAIARASQPLQEILQRAGLTERIGFSYFFPTVRTGVRSFIEHKEELTGETS